MIPARRLVALGVLSAALLATGSLEARSRRGPPGPAGAGTANPSALVATEIALNREMREKGQWQALRDYADEAAVLFAPQPVLAQQWLGGRKAPAAPLQWHPSEVWMSCDGTMGLTTGAWRRADGSRGSYTTIWKQRPKKLYYRWVLDLASGEAGPSAPAPDAAPAEGPEAEDLGDFLHAQVTDCPAPQPWRLAEREKREAEITVTAQGPASQGQSDDGTFKWRYATSPEGHTVLYVSVLKNGENRKLTFDAQGTGGENWP